MVFFLILIHQQLGKDETGRSEVRCPADILEPVLITGGFLGGAIGGDFSDSHWILLL